MLLYVSVVNLLQIQLLTRWNYCSYHTDPNASDGINEPEFEGAGEGDNNSNGDIDNNGQGNVSQSTPDLKNGIGAPAIAAMAVGGFLIIAAGFLLRRKPKREEEEAAAAGGILGVSGGDDDDLSDLEPQTNSLPSDMVDIKLTDDV